MVGLRFLGGIDHSLKSSCFSARGLIMKRPQDDPGTKIVEESQSAQIDNRISVSPLITDPNWHQVARLVFLSRQIDQLEIAQLVPSGETKLQISSSGHELVQVLLGLALTHPHDAATVYYRSRPFLLASGLTAEEALSASLARCGSPSEGRDVGVVFSLPRRGGAMVLPASGNVGAQYTPATGWAQSVVYRQQSLGDAAFDGALGVAMGGEGSTAANGFWAALNIATTNNLPMLFFIEDNEYAISTPSDVQTPTGVFTTNLAAFQNLKIVEGNGSDPVAAWRAIADSLHHVRSGSGPCLIRMRVPRLSGHALSDTQHYKTEAMLEADAARDPLCHLKEFLLQSGQFTPQALNQLAREVEIEVSAALKIARAQEAPRPSDVAKHVLFEEPPLVGGLRPEQAQIPFGCDQAKTTGPSIDLREAICRTLRTEMEFNDRALLFGEDVGAFGGIHGVTRGLQGDLGSDRVFDTSLSEEGIIGRAIGMALCGLLPIPELQFRKYADPAYEQLVDVGTLRWRTAGKFAVPMVVRIPVGYGKKGGDPWHSVNSEATYAHLQGWRIAYPSNVQDAVGLLRTALRGDDPTFFLEHRALLVAQRGAAAYPGDDYCLPFGVAARRTEGTDLTIVAWGDMVHRSIEAANSFSGRVTVLDLRTVLPWDQATVLASVRRTGRLLVVHEDTATAGFAGEIIATVAAEAFDALKASPQRLCALDCPIPYNVELMAEVVPSVDQIGTMIEQLLNR